MSRSCFSELKKQAYKVSILCLYNVFSMPTSIKILTFINTFNLTTAKATLWLTGDDQFL